MKRAALFGIGMFLFGASTSLSAERDMRRIEPTSADERRILNLLCARFDKLTSRQATTWVMDRMAGKAHQDEAPGMPMEVFMRDTFCPPAPKDAF